MVNLPSESKLCPCGSHSRMFCVGVLATACVPLESWIKTNRQADLDSHSLLCCALGQLLALTEGEAVSDSLDTCA